MPQRVPAIEGVRIGEDDHVLLRAARVQFRARPGAHALREGQSVTFSIRPEKLAIFPAGDAPPIGSDLEQLPATLKEVVYIGTDTRYIVDLPQGGELVVREQNSTAPRAARPQKGDAVHIRWRPADGRILLE